MVRLTMAFLVAFLLSPAAGWCQDAPKADAVDTIADDVKKARSDYRAGLEKAGAGLLVAFANEQKKLEQNTSLKVDMQIKLIEQLRDEKSAFEADPARLPAAPTMKSAVAEYVARTAAAKKKCEEAYAKAADGYRVKKEFESAKSVLAELDDFRRSAAGDRDLRGVPGTKVIAGRDALTRSINGTKWTFHGTATATLSFRADGTVLYSDNAQIALWVALDEHRVVLTWPSNDYDVLTFAPDRKSYLKEWIGRPVAKGRYVGHPAEKK